MTFDFKDDTSGYGYSGSENRRGYDSGGYEDKHSPDYGSSSRGGYGDYEDSGGAGFQSKPEEKKPYNSFRESQSMDLNSYTGGRPTSARLRRIRTAGVRPGVNLPTLRWDILIPVAILLIVLVTLYVLRDTITMFISQLLSWVLTLAVIFLILRWLFPGRGRGR